MIVSQLSESINVRSRCSVNDLTLKKMQSALPHHSLIPVLCNLIPVLRNQEFLPDLPETDLEEFSAIWHSVFNTAVLM